MRNISYLKFFQVNTKHITSINYKYNILLKTKSLLMFQNKMNFHLLNNKLYNNKINNNGQNIQKTTFVNNQFKCFFKKTNILRKKDFYSN